jgi:hypothetical protein
MSNNQQLKLYYSRQNRYCQKTTCYMYKHQKIKHGYTWNVNYFLTLRLKIILLLKIKRL